jgi:hypothetical protein
VRAAFSFLASVVVTVGCVGTSSCVLDAGEPCCRVKLDCADGLSCFEGRCSPMCDDDAQCNEGEVCLEDAKVCRAVEREPSTCPYDDEDAP